VSDGTLPLYFRYRKYNGTNLNKFTKYRLHQADVACFVPKQELLREFTHASSVVSAGTRYGLDISLFDPSSHSRG